MRFAVISAVVTVTLGATPALAGEAFAGLLVHEVDTPFTLKTFEKGTDVQFGYRGERIEALKAIGAPSAYLFGSVNTSGDTSFAATGLSWKIGKRLFFRPAVGLALHNGHIPINGPAGRRVDLGSRVLFEPEVGLGYQFSDKFSLEANWTHISNARVLSKQNPGLDLMGVRMSVRI
jgi:lipid A 3-O-deacylase